MTETTGNPPPPGRRARPNTVAAIPSDAVSRLDKLQPQNVEAEQAVLGAAFIDNEVMSDLAVKLRAEDFYRLTHRYIFEAMLHLYERREPIDYVTVLEALDRIRAERQLDRLEVEIELDYLAELAERVPTATNALFYAAQVRHKAVLRELIGATTEINRESFEFAGELSEFLDTVEQRIFSITQRDMGRDITSIRSVLHEIFNKLDEYQDRAGRLTGIPSGYFGLDELTGGFQDGEMIVLAARPSMGKTTLALSVSRYIGLQEKIPTVFFSCEMGRSQLVQNMLCAEARLDSRRMRSGYLDEYEYDKLVQAAGKLAEAPIYVDDTPGIGIREVRAKTRRLRERYGIRIVFIDYLQLMSKPPGLNRNSSREQEIALISRGLKALSRELNIPIVVLAQLNRDVEKRTGSHRPRMSDLRESGSIEQDADVIGLLHREFYYTRNEEDRRSAELILAKQRNGPTGTAPLMFIQEYMRFDNPEDEAGEELPMRRGGAMPAIGGPGAMPGLPHLVANRGATPSGPVGLGGLPPDVAGLDGGADTNEGIDEDEFGDAPFDYDGDDIPPVF